MGTFFTSFLIQLNLVFYYTVYRQPDIGYQHQHQQRKKEYVHAVLLHRFIRDIFCIHTHTNTLYTYKLYNEKERGENDNHYYSSVSQYQGCGRVCTINNRPSITHPSTSWAPSNSDSNNLPTAANRRPNPTRTSSLQLISC